MKNLGEKKVLLTSAKAGKSISDVNILTSWVSSSIGFKTPRLENRKKVFAFLFRRWRFRETKKVFYLWDLCWIHSLVDHIGRGELDSGMSKHVTEIKRTHIVSLSLFVFYLSLLLIYSLLSFRLYRFIFSNQSQRLPFAHTDHSFHNTYPSGF